MSYYGGVRKIITTLSPDTQPICSPFKMEHSLIEVRKSVHTFASTCIIVQIVQIGHDVGSNFNIHI